MVMNLYQRYHHTGLLLLSLYSDQVSSSVQTLPQPHTLQSWPLSPTETNRKLLFVIELKISHETGSPGAKF